MTNEISHPITGKPGKPSIPKPEPPKPVEKLKAIKEVLDCDVPDLEPHQKHSPYHPVFTTGYRCIDVIAMEKADGRHQKDCSFVGFISAKKCGCNG